MQQVTGEDLRQLVIGKQLATDDNNTLCMHNMYPDVVAETEEGGGFIMSKSMIALVQFHPMQNHVTLVDLNSHTEIQVLTYFKTAWKNY